MKKLLLIAAICLLAGCSTQKEISVKSKELHYRELVKEGKISIDDYFFLVDQEKELNEMKLIKP